MSVIWKYGKKLSTLADIKYGKYSAKKRNKLSNFCEKLYIGAI